MIFRILLVLAGVLALTTCNDDDAVCKSPIPVLGTPAGLGYIVGTAEDVDPAALATEYIEAYGDDIDVFSTTATYFAADMTRQVLDALRCDDRVSHIDYRSQGVITAGSP
jgi:hypothetical protein